MMTLIYALDWITSIFFLGAFVLAMYVGYCVTFRKRIWILDVKPQTIMGFRVASGIKMRSDMVVIPCDKCGDDMWITPEGMDVKEKFCSGCVYEEPVLASSRSVAVNYIHPAAFRERRGKVSAWLPAD